MRHLTPEVLALLAGAAALLVLLAAWGYYLYTAPRQVAADVAEPTATRQRDDTFVLHRITEAVGRPLVGTMLEWLGSKGQDRIEERISAAGRPEGLTVQRYVRRKCGEVLIYGLTGLVLLFTGHSMLAVIVLVFILLTDIELFMKARQRQDEIQRQLPDFLDVLAVTVGSGLAFRLALERTADAMPGVLAEEFRTALRQMELGTSRREAFDAMRRRNNNEALGKFVIAIQQSEELGAPLGQTLAEIGQDVRREDYQYRRRHAQRVNPRVTMVTAATLLPAMLVLVASGLFIGSGAGDGPLLGG